MRWGVVIVAASLLLSACGSGGGGGGGGNGGGGGGNPPPPPPPPTGVLGTAERLEDATPQAKFPRIAVAPSGAAVAVWNQADGNGRARIWARAYVPTSGWFPAVEIDNAGATRNAIGAPSVAIDQQGRAIATWVQPDPATPTDIGSLWANRYDPATGWGLAELIDTRTTYVTNPKVAMNGAGTAVVVWTQFDGTHSRVYANRSRAGTASWDGPVTLDDNTTHVDSLWPAFLNVSLDSAGNTVVTWVQPDAVTATTNNLNAAYIAAGTTWADGAGVVATLAQAVQSSATTTALFSVSAVANQVGEAIVAWDLWSTDTATSTLTFSLFARQFVTGAWAATAPLGEGVAPKLGTSGAGATILTAAGNNVAINNSSVLIIPHASGTGWGNRRFLEDVNGSAPEIAMSSDGRAMVLWNYIEGTPPATRYRLRANFFNGAAWSTPDNLDNQGTGDMMNYVVGLDGQGYAIALWLQDNFSVWANRFSFP